MKIGLLRRKNYHRTYIEDISSRFDEIRPVVLHLEVRLPEKPLNPKNIGEAIKGPHRKFRREDLFVQYGKNKNVSLPLATIRIKPLPDVTKVLC